MVEVEKKELVTSVVEKEVVVIDRDVEEEEKIGCVVGEDPVVISAVVRVVTVSEAA